MAMGSPRRAVNKMSLDLLRTCASQIDKSIEEPNSIVYSVQWRLLLEPYLTGAAVRFCPAGADQSGEANGHMPDDDVFRLAS